MTSSEVFFAELETIGYSIATSIRVSISLYKGVLLLTELVPGKT